MIDAVQGITSPFIKPDVNTNPIAKTSDQTFVDALNSAKGLLEDTKAAENVTDQLTTDFMTGKNDNIHSLLIAQEKSSILLQYTMQVRNQVLESYREIMRIPV